MTPAAGTGVLTPPAPAPRPRRPRSGSKRQLEGKRLDIQGLRMVAVVAVVINHLTGHPRGGFVGVDVFFVISGFLITGLLLRDLGGNAGPVRYVLTFYRRRVRRLFPALFLVIIATLVASHIVLNAHRFQATKSDAGWAAIFWANWHLITVGTDYFTASEPPSPLQHYWSLSVEEQFYVVWPVALYLLVFLVRKRRSMAARRWTAGSAAGVVIVASLVFAAGQSTSNPVSAYFSTATRAWELALGALLACVVPLLRTNAIVLTAMSWTGLVLIGISLFLSHGGSGFPVPGALLPCIGAGLVLAASSNDGERARNGLLTCRPSVFVGDISYSVYLVHFPVIILLAAYMGERNSYYYVTAILLTLGVSVALYGLVERPILESSWLLGKNPNRYIPTTSIGMSRLALAGVMAVVLGLGVFALWPGREAANLAKLNKVNAALAQASGANTPTDEQTGPAQTRLSSALTAALGQSSWPTLSPPLDKPKRGIAAKAGCGILLQTPKKCTWGPSSAKHTMYLVGDSTSVFYDDGFIKLVQNLPGWKVRVAGGSACAFADKTLNDDAADFRVKDCPARNRALVKELKKAKPDVLIVTTVHGDDASNTAVEGELAKVKSDVKKIVILPAPVPGQDPSKCYTKTSSPADCVSQPGPAYESWMTNEQAMATKLHGTFIDNTSWYCYAGECPIFAKNVPMHLDAAHITPQYAQYIEPVILEAFKKAKVFS